jgi:acyl carrier protein
MVGAFPSPSGNLERPELAAASIPSIVASVLGISELEVSGQTGPATEGGWTSLRHLEIVAAVQREYAVSLTPREIRSVRSVAALQKLIGERAATP